MAESNQEDDLNSKKDLKMNEGTFSESSSTGAPSVGAEGQSGGISKPSLQMLDPDKVGVSIFCQNCLHPYSGTPKGGNFVLRCDKCGHRDIVREDLATSLDQEAFDGDLMMNRFLHVLKEQDDLHINILDPDFIDDGYKNLINAIEEYTTYLNVTVRYIQHIARTSKDPGEDSSLLKDTNEEIGNDKKSISLEANENAICENEALPPAENELVNSRPCSHVSSNVQESDVQEQAYENRCLKESETECTLSETKLGEANVCKSEQKENTAKPMKTARKFGLEMIRVVKILVEKYELPQEIWDKTVEALKMPKQKTGDDSFLDLFSEEEDKEEEEEHLPSETANKEEHGILGKGVIRTLRERIMKSKERGIPLDELSISDSEEEKEEDEKHDKMEDSRVDVDKVEDIDNENGDDENRKHEGTSKTVTAGANATEETDNRDNVCEARELSDLRKETTDEEREDFAEKVDESSNKADEPSDKAEESSKVSDGDPDIFENKTPRIGVEVQSEEDHRKGKTSKKTRTYTINIGKEFLIFSKPNSGDDWKKRREIIAIDGEANYSAAAVEFLNELQSYKAKLLKGRKDKALALVNDKIVALKAEVDRVEERVRTDLHKAYDAKMQKVENQRLELASRQRQVQNVEFLLTHYLETGQMDKLSELLEQLDIQYEN